MSSDGGRDDLGVIFRVTPAGVGTILYEFTGVGTDGAYPNSDLVQGKNGNLYGTTEEDGGSSNMGTVFSIPLAGGKPTIIHSFTGQEQDGASPAAGLVRGADGNLYGVTFAGGTTNDGTFFTVSTTDEVKTLHSFAERTTEGAEPGTMLIQGKDSRFYGVTEGGGNGTGTVFSISAAGDDLKLV